VVTEDDITTHENGILGVIRDALDKGARGFLCLSMGSAGHFSPRYFVLQNVSNFDDNPVRSV
jgi:hypothetical protein